MRKISMILVLVLFASIFSFMGCDEPLGPPPDNGGLTFGPPYNDIAYITNTKNAATIRSDGTDALIHIPGVGHGSSLPDPGLTVTWKPLSSIDNPSFAVFNSDDNIANVLNATGSAIEAYDSVKTYFYSFSSAGTRMVYVQNNQNGTESVAVEGIYPISGKSVYAIAESPVHFSSIPSVNANMSKIVVASENDFNHEEDRITIWNSNGDIVKALVGRAVAPQYSHDSEYIAFIPAPNGPEQATNLVVMNSTLNETIADVSFNGIGATGFAWSNDNTKIALFTDVFTDSPKLIVIAVGPEEAEIIPLNETIAVGQGDQLLWSVPSWNYDNSALAITVKNGEKYGIITTTLSGNTVPLVEDLNEYTVPSWINQPISDD